MNTKNTYRPPRILWASLLLALWSSGGSHINDAAGEDRVVVQRSDSGDTITRSGTITDWKGDSLTLEIEGRQREIKNDSILDVQTTWSTDFLEAKNLIQNGDLIVAQAKLKSALAEEQRPWARLSILAEMVRVELALDHYASAIKNFLTIVRSDPQTRFFDLCPLPWIAGGRFDPQQADSLMKSSDVTQQLIGASWLLIGEQSESATQTLERLTRDVDPRIAHLATAQLWRVRALQLNTINQRQIDVWISLIEKMPTNLRAGPWYLVAETQLRKQNKESAIINFMRIPILYPQRLDLSAAALYQAAQLLNNRQRSRQAQILLAELKQKYPDSIWARQASANED